MAKAKNLAITQASPSAQPADESTGRVGYLAKMFPRVSETFILNEVLALRKQGVPVSVYSLHEPTRDARMHAEAAAITDEVFVLPEPEATSWSELMPALFRCLDANPRATLMEVIRVLMRPRALTRRRFVRAILLAERLRADRIAHLHAAWAHTPASVARIASRLTGIPWSMGAHAKDIHLSKPSSIAKKLRAARFTVTCTRSNHLLLSNLGQAEEPGLPAPDVRVFHHGVDADYFRPAPPHPAGGVPVILSVGRLVEKKGFDILIDAAAILVERGHDFVVEIVGEGPLRPTLEKQIRRAGLDEKIQLCGLMLREEVRSAYWSASCVVLASRITAEGDRDGIPNTLAEAMACALPVVATQQTSIAELVIDGETGILVPPDNPRELADALESVLNGGPQVADMARRGRERICQHFDGDHWGKRLAERLGRSLGIEKVLYLSADRGVPVKGAKGASVHLRSLVKAFGSFDVETRVLTTRTGPTDGPAIDAQLIETRTPWDHRSSQPLKRELLRLLDNIPLYRRGHEQGRYWHPDFIYERYALTALAGTLLARRLNVPHVIEVNAPLAWEEEHLRALRLRRLTRFLEGWILRRADAVVVVSESVQDHVAGLGVQTDRIMLLPNAVDLTLFDPESDGKAARDRLGPNNNFVVGFAGSLKPWQGVDHLLRAFALLSVDLKESLLFIAGEGPQRKSLEKLADKLGIKSHVRFLGAVPHEEIGDLFAAAQVLVAPYQPTDNFYFSPMKIAEYRAAGRPVVASALGEISQRYDEEQGVVLVPPGDHKALADAIGRLATDDVRRVRLGTAAAASSHHTWQDVARKILDSADQSRRTIWAWQQ